MVVKRARDSAGLLPDHLTVTFGNNVASDFAALAEIMDAGSPAGRIKALRRRPELASQADALAARCDAADGNADMRLLHDIAQAEARAVYLDAAPRLRKANAATAQRGRASKSAAEVRQEKATARKSLARKIAANVSPRIKEQGRTAIAREVVKEAAKLSPRTDASEGLAGLTPRRVVALISD